MDVEVRTLAGDDELEQAWLLDRQAFNSPAAERDRWLQGLVPERTHGVFVDDRLVGMGTVHALGQFFGGRSVPMGGVASVAVAPDHRGRGIASALLQSMLPAMRAWGEVISTLSPATTRLYRGLGWEVAGVHGGRAVPARSLNQLTAGAGASVRQGGRDDLPAIAACYGRVAPRTNGFVDRPEWYWEQTLGARWNERYVYVVDGDDDDGGVDGYMNYEHLRSPVGWGYGLRVHDIVARHADALLALWRTVGSSASQVREVHFCGPPEDPLLLLLPEQDLTYHTVLRWMLRLVDAPGAVAARGFPHGVDVTVDLEVRDRQCEWNDGTWRLVVSGGRGKLERGGLGTVRIGIGTFSSLWSGYASARTLELIGGLTGATAKDRDALDAVFAGPTPWMVDAF